MQRKKAYLPYLILLLAAACTFFMLSGPAWAQDTGWDSGSVYSAEGEPVDSGPLEGGSDRFKPYKDDPLIQEDNVTITPYSDPWIDAFREKSLEYQMVELQNKKAAQQYEVLVEKATNSEKQIQQLIETIEATEKQKAEYEASGNIIGQLNANAMLKNYELQLKSYVSSYADVCLERDISSISALQVNRAASEQQRIAEYNFYQLYTQVPLFHAQTALLQAELEQLKTALSAEKVKLETGYSTALQVDQIEAAILSKETELGTVKGQYETLTWRITAECGRTDFDTILLEPPEVKGDKDTYIKRYMQGNTTSSTLSANAEAYRRYLEYTKEINETSSQAADIQSQMAKLQLEQYRELDLPSRVLEQMQTNKSSIATLSVINEEIKLAEEQQRINQLLWNKGNITALPLEEGKVRQAQLTLQKAQLNRNAALSYFALEYGVE